MYRERKNDWHRDLQQLQRLFRDVARFDGPYSRAANVNAFNLFHAKAAYSVDFDVQVGRALLTHFDALRFDNHSDDGVRKSHRFAANNSERVLRAELRGLGLARLDVEIVLRAIRAAAFACYLDDVDASRRFAQ